MRARDTLPAPARPASVLNAGPDQRTGGRIRLLSLLAVAGISGSALIMAAVSLAGPSMAVVRLPGPGIGPPWWIPLRPSAFLVTVSLWIAAALGGTGVAAGLAAIARGARPSGRALVIAALVVTAVLTVLPSAGSSDTLDYASYGRIAALGHSPYRMTPLELRSTGDPIGAIAPTAWENSPSVYGPLATMEQEGAALLGGASPAAVIFWLKLGNSLAFAAVALALDRLLRGDPARRARAHLLWSVNPLLLWGLVAAGHIDALAAAAGLLGVLALTGGAEGGRLTARRGLAAGLLIGAAADIKITFAVFGVAVAWTARRSPRTVLAAAAGALAVLVPTYLAFGTQAAAVLLSHSGSATTDNYYRMFNTLLGIQGPGLAVLAVPLFLGVGALLLRRLPDHLPRLSAVQPAVALSVAWLLVWPYQRPWYDAIAFCVLVLYPASRLDQLMLLRLLVVTAFYMPGMPGQFARYYPWLATVNNVAASAVLPTVRFGVLAAVVGLGVTGAWHARRGSPDRFLAHDGDFAELGQLTR